MTSFDDRQPIRRMMRAYRTEIDAVLDEFLPTRFSTAAYSDLASNPEFLAAAERIARRMVLGVSVQNARSWRDAARKSMKGRMVRSVLQNELRGSVGTAIMAEIQENARLISGIPLDLAQRITAFIAEQQGRGIRADAITEQLRDKLPQLKRSRVALISRTETGKAESAVTRARAEALNLPYYEWLTSEDQRVRKSHRKMAGVLVPWADPPSPEILAGEPSEGRYAPGGIWNCRCVAAPLVSLDEVTWPHRVYRAGRIRTMTRAEFTRLVGMPLAA